MPPNISNRIGAFFQIFILFIVYVCVYDANISEVTGMEMFYKLVLGFLFRSYTFLIVKIILKFITYI